MAAGTINCYCLTSRQTFEEEGWRSDDAFSSKTHTSRWCIVDAFVSHIPFNDLHSLCADGRPPMSSQSSFVSGSLWKYAVKSLPQCPLLEHGTKFYVPGPSATRSRTASMLYVGRRVEGRPERLIGSIALIYIYFNLFIVKSLLRKLQTIAAIPTAFWCFYATLLFQ